MAANAIQYIHFYRILKFYIIWFLWTVNGRNNREIVNIIVTSVIDIIIEKNKSLKLEC